MFNDTHIDIRKKKILIRALFANFEAKRGQNGSKKSKNVFYKFVFERDVVCQKRSKSLYPTVNAELLV